MGWAKCRGVVALSLLSFSVAACSGAENTATPLQGTPVSVVTTVPKTDKERAEADLTALTNEYFRVLTTLYFDPATASAGPLLRSVAAGDGWLYTKADVDAMRSKGNTASGEPLKMQKTTFTRMDLPAAGPAVASATVCFEAPPGFVTKTRNPDGTFVAKPGFGRKQLLLEFRNEGWPAAKSWRDNRGWKVVRNSLFQDKKVGECNA